MAVYRHAESLQLFAEGARGGLGFVARQNDAADVKPEMTENVDETQHILVICYAEVAAFFVFFDVARVYDDNDLSLILQLKQHAQLAVRLKAGEHPRCVIVVIQFAAEFKVELVAEFGDALAYMLRLELEIFIVVKTCPVHYGRFSFLTCLPCRKTKIYIHYTTSYSFFQ